MELIYPASLDNKSIKSSFINQLSLLFCAKNHLLDHLPDFINNATFNNLKLALIEDLQDTKTQMISLRSIFGRLEESALTECCIGMNAVIKEALGQIITSDINPYESDMSIIFYMGVIENMQMGASRMINLIATKLAYTQYAQLVTECYDINNDNAELFHCVAKEYLNNQ